MESDEFIRRQEASHLQDTSALKEEVEKSVKGQGEKTIDLKDPKAAKSYTFSLDYTDAHGKTWAGSFTTKILSIGERQLVGALRARMSGGAQVESLDALTVEINLMLAHLAYSLTDKPKWADNLAELEDVGVVQAIYSEVASHEAYFLGW